MSAVKMSANPQQVITEAINQNPTLANLIKMASSNGINMQQLFYYLAQQAGVNPEDVLRALQ